jgi:probable LLM family oxidoreductase
MELGVFSFVEIDSAAGPDPQAAAQRLHHLLEEIELADRVGLDVFGVGEHHRPDYVVSSPGVVLAAAAARNRRIHLTSAVNVLSSDDPVRVFQQFATLDLLSGGRAEIMAGRGSFVESFPLFGFDLGDYDTLFAENLELLLTLRASERVTWSGRHRAAIHDLGVYPRPLQQPLPVWIAVGGTTQSAHRAGSLGLPMAIAIIGGAPDRFTTFAEIHREAALAVGHEPPAISINGHGFIAEDSWQAADTAYGPFAATMDRIGRERGWPSMTRQQFEASRALRGASFIGSPDEIIEKILFQHRLFRHQRCMLQFTVGPMPHDAVLRSIELFGTRVAPVIRSELAVRSRA